MTSPTIKIGLISGFTGQHAELTESQLMGIQLGVEEINARGGVLGRMLELSHYDDELSSAKAVAIAEQLIAERRVDVLLGTLAANTVIDVNRVAVTHNFPFMAICQTKLLTDSEHLGAYTFHEALTPYMGAQLITKWGTEHLGKRWYFIGYDFQFAKDCISAFHEVLPKFGGTILGTSIIPSEGGAEAYMKVFDEIAMLKPDVLSVTNFGTQQVDFAKAAHKRGITKEMSVVNTISDLYIINHVGLDALVGMYWGANFYWKLKDTIPSAKLFVEQFEKRFQVPPTGYAGYAYSGILEFAAAIEASETYPIDPMKVSEFLEGRSYDHYKGRQWWRPCDHQSFQNLYIMRFKGPEESVSKYDIGEIVATVEWDLDIEKTCAHLGHNTHLGGWGERGTQEEFKG